MISCSETIHVNIQFMVGILSLPALDGFSPVYYIVDERASEQPTVYSLEALLATWWLTA